MIREQTWQNEYEFVSIEELVPEEHLLMKIDRAIDFGFIRKKKLKIYIVRTTDDQE